MATGNKNFRGRYSQKKYFGLGRVPVGIGAVLKGRDITEEEFRDPKRLPAVDARFMTEACPHDCIHCLTARPKRTLTLAQIRQIIDKLAEFRPKGIELEGEGEPTIDPYFFEIIEHISSKGIVPTVYTEAAARLRDRKFVKRMKKSNATVCVKIDSFYNPDYQNWLVRDKTGKYFSQRNEAVNVLMEEGFNKPNPDGTTRLGFIMVVSRKNMHEIPRLLRYCRSNNIWVIFNTILRSGKVLENTFEKSLFVTEPENDIWRAEVKKIGRDEFGFDHAIYPNFATAPCVEYLLVHGDGSVSRCPGNLERIGNILQDSVPELRRKLSMRFPDYVPERFDGCCPYRPKLYGTYSLG